MIVIMCKKISLFLPLYGNTQKKESGEPMKFRGIWKWSDSLGQWILHALYLQLLWFIFTIIGVVLFGIMPATIAVFTVWRKLTLEGNDIPIFKTFMKSYKDNFIKTNGLGLLFFAVGLFIYFDLKIIEMNINWYPLYLVFLFLFVIYVTVLLFFFPVYVHYDLKTIQYPKQSLLIALSRPLETLGMIISLVILYYIFIYVPILLFFVGISFVAYPLTLIAIRAFDKLDEKASKLEQ